MVVFWLVTVVMVVVALSFVLVPLLRSKKTETGALDEAAVNVTVYRERLAELEAEHAEGKIDQAEFAKLQLEQQRALLEDASMASEKKALYEGKRWLLPAVLLVLLPISSYGLYFQLGASALLTAQPANEADNPHAAGGMVEMLASLKEELKANPDNSQGWFTLGRIYLSIGRYEEAVTAFDRVTEILGQEHAEILSQKAQALYFGAGNQMTPEVQSIIDRALADDPNDPQLNGLLGMVAFDQGRFAQSITYWETMLANAREGMSEEGIRQAIEVARQQLAQSGGEMPSPAAAVSSQPQTSSDAGLLGGKPVKVLVELDTALVSEVSAGETVFVALKRAGGPPMPIAAVKFSARELPALITLDDSNLLGQAPDIAADVPLVLVATLSKSGTAGAKSGDSRGMSAPMTLGDMGEKVIPVNIGTLIP
ncbi:c-type cytochrome biogenesis protein CcmI [Aestuariirhabdus sp. Z084]|uniref:c-type cytochrome biogenesis protein CcmI n=1 Tax=Aestuariirhabdus haliotis TaxID=2918751 RepID=UPI00201B3549|nr:c-type cytochrome biogenesis protein CcmI [Aestuariirhabdus haliotis]MCL6415868.1 c-type cytochrome biogenesis protein CcmI [Aestuariirhabdus haliotis]MCL6419830.1 c-type cytochrome biogenesis protein CcmI [Aestuariirhabdus haliotis]